MVPIQKMQLMQSRVPQKKRVPVLLPPSNLLQMYRMLQTLPACCSPLLFHLKQAYLMAEAY